MFIDDNGNEVRRQYGLFGTEKLKELIKYIDPR